MATKVSTVQSEGMYIISIETDDKMLFRQIEDECEAIIDTDEMRKEV